MDLAPSGWYPDPYGTPDLLRWGDGWNWTRHTHPVVGTGAPGGAVQATAVQAATAQPAGGGWAARDRVIGDWAGTDWPTGDQLATTMPPRGPRTEPQPALPTTTYQPTVQPTTVQPSNGWGMAGQHAGGQGATAYLGGSTAGAGGPGGA